MTKPPQLSFSLPLEGPGDSNLVRVPRAQNKKRGAALAAAIQSLGFKDKKFLPVLGVPKTHADCPPASVYCPHLQCREHLAMIDAEHRAGRPGLADVPRNSKGLTMAVKGKAGEKRAGMTFDARWLELERRCKVYCERNDEGGMLALHAVYENEADFFLERLRVGEPIDVMDGEFITGQEKLERVMGATLTQTGALKFDRDPVGVMSSYIFTLQRVRGVESCALRRANKGPSSNQETGESLGRHRTLVAREVKRAALKLKAMGIDIRDVMEGE